VLVPPGLTKDLDAVAVLGEAIDKGDNACGAREGVPPLLEAAACARFCAISGAARTGRPAPWLLLLRVVDDVVDADGRGRLPPIEQGGSRGTSRLISGCGHAAAAHEPGLERLRFRVATTGCPRVSSREARPSRARTS
jgi:hypothetical protein